VRQRARLRKLLPASHNQIIRSEIPKALFDVRAAVTDECICISSMPGRQSNRTLTRVEGVGPILAKNNTGQIAFAKSFIVPGHIPGTYAIDSRRH
ncbi:MAG TPA: hypothetical protein DCL69_10435, partial [Firmicutes bacterium]|nr:hypothetical protein [Bacillota bacterium]